MKCNGVPSQRSTETIQTWRTGQNDGARTGCLNGWDSDAEGLSAFQTYVFKPTDVVRPPMNSLNRLRNGGTIAPLICNPNSHFGEVL